MFIDHYPHGIRCFTKVLTPVQSGFKMLPQQISDLSGTDVVETHSAKASGNSTVLEHLHIYM